MISTVIDCVDLDAEVAFFTREMGAKVHLVRPADDPRCVVVEIGAGAGASRLELRRAPVDRPACLSIEGPSTTSKVHDGELHSPGGSVIEFVSSSTDVEVPMNVPSLIAVEGGAGGFAIGRAGMEYRDLLPDRWGGRFIASHIRIGDGGDVADWVHFHRIRFQMIFVAAGWVDLVYEDQGEPFRMEAGDAVLQPPQIRHRVLRSSAGLEVIEIGCPAEHDTIADHDLELPTPAIRADRDFGGQRFVRYRAAGAPTQRWVDDGFVVRDTGIGVATGGLAGAVVVSAAGPSAASVPLTHDGEFAMIVGLRGHAVVSVDGHAEITLAPLASIALPAGSRWRWRDVTTDHEALVVTLPADAVHAVDS